MLWEKEAKRNVELMWLLRKLSPDFKTIADFRKDNKEKYKMRQWLNEHPFGTIKRAMNQGYLLMRGLEKVAAEISLTILAYNIKRVINIVGIKGLIEAVS